MIYIFATFTGKKVFFIHYDTQQTNTIHFADAWQK